VLRFGYGAIVPWVTSLEDGTLRAIAGPDMAILHTPVHTRGQNLTTVADFTLSVGEMVPFLLTYVPSHASLPRPLQPQSEFEATERFWQTWASACRPAGPWSDIVERSLITAAGRQFPTSLFTLRARQYRFQLDAYDQTYRTARAIGGRKP
jgi:hypothetical protein